MDGENSSARLKEREREREKKEKEKEEESWEVRPGGMLVQRRDPDADASVAGPLIRVKVCFGRSQHHVSISAHSTFGELKKVLVECTGLQPKQQRLLYKKKERRDSDYLFEYRVKDKSKIVLVEDEASWERRLVELRKNEAMAKACRAISEAQQTVDKLSGQVVSIEEAISSGEILPNDELSGLIDSLMGQLVVLDANKVEGDANVKKTILIRRAQRYVEKLDALKAKNEMSMKRIQQSNGSSAKQTRADPALRTASSASPWESFGAHHLGVNPKPLDLRPNPNPKPPPSARDRSPRPAAATEPLLIQWD